MNAPVGVATAVVALALLGAAVAQGGGGHAVLAPGYEYDWSNDGQVRVWGRVGL